MEIQLQELIERIKTDGVAAADAEATARLEAAQAEADRIVREAKAEAEALLRQAQEENARLVRVSEDAIRQAGRNLLISFRESVTKELDLLLRAQVDEAYSPAVLGELIPKVVEAWSANAGAGDIAVLLTGEDLTALEKSLLAALKKRMLDGVTLRPDDSFRGGFRIAVDGGSAYYDYAADSVADMFAAHLNPRVAALLKEAENA